MTIIPKSSLASLPIKSLSLPEATTVLIFIYVHKSKIKENMLFLYKTSFKSYAFSLFLSCY